MAYDYRSASGRADVGSGAGEALVAVGSVFIILDVCMAAVTACACAL